jgi:flavin-dependent dehydrogenase
MVERERFPRDKPCGGVATLGLLDLVGNEVDEVIEGRPTRTRFILNMRPVLEYDDPDLLFKRVRFDRLLAALAVEEGAGLQEGSCVEDLHFGHEDHVEVRLAGGDVLKARAVVGADGAYGTVAKAAGFRVPLAERPGNFALYVECELPRSRVDALLGPLEDGLRHSYFWTQMCGMAWVFRKEGGINAGIGMHGMGHTDLHDRAVRWLDAIGLGDLSPDLRGHHIPGRFLPRVTGHRVLLVGDAAGAANPCTGCGIEDAIKTGLLAARALATLHGAGRSPTTANLAQYEASLTTLRRIPRSKLWLVRAIRWFQRRGWDTDFWMDLILRTVVRFDLERFIWSDASRF